MVHVAPGRATAIVAGSGIDLTGVFDETHDTVPFSAVDGLVPSTVQGHASKFIHGVVAGVPVILQQGRLHAYEGFDFETITRTVDCLAQWNTSAVIFTNAVGGLRDDLVPGNLIAAEAIHAWPYNRLRLPEIQRPDWVLPGADARGAYWWMHGPCYETRAEIRALRQLGGASVGMSTAPELLRCARLGIRTAVVSCVTNACAIPQTLTHRQVLQTAQRTSTRLTQLLRQILLDGHTSAEGGAKR